MLKCNRITKSYQTGIQSVKAVSDVTLEFFRGIHMIKGKSGSGKTTLFHMLGGLCPPDEGQVFFSEKCTVFVKRGRADKDQKRKL